MNLKQQIEKIVLANDAKLYDIETVTNGEESIYRVYITKKEGINLDLCAEISRELSPLLDVNPPMAGKYILEVSSPGINRKLSIPKHFIQSIGDKVKVKILGGEKLKGILLEADDKGIVIEDKEGNHSFKYDELGTVKTYFEF